MASYHSDGIADIPFTASADLTSWQWKLVQPASAAGGVVKFESTGLGAASPLAIGVLTNDPSSGQEASVKCIGFTKVKARTSVCDLSHGAWLTGASDGLVEPCSAIDGSDHVVGRWFGPKNTTRDASILGSMLVFITGTCLATNS